MAKITKTFDVDATEVLEALHRDTAQDDISDDPQGVEWLASVIREAHVTLRPEMFFVAASGTRWANMTNVLGTTVLVVGSLGGDELTLASMYPEQDANAIASFNKAAIGAIN